MGEKRVLLLGSYGHSNLGDDLLMWNYLEFLKGEDFTTIYVNANTTEYIPDIIKRTYPDLHIINTYRTSLLAYIKIIRSVDCVVYGGGTLYKELYASTGRSPYSVITRLMGINLTAKLLGTKLYHLHIGIGSLKTWKGKFITKRALSAATYTLFRDKKSYDIAKTTLNINSSKIMKSTDGLFIDHIWETEWEKAPLSIDRRRYKRVIGINVLSDIPDWVDREQYIDIMRQFVRSELEKGTYIIFVPFQTAFNPRNDLTFIEEIFGDIIAKKENVTLLRDVPLQYIHSYLRLCDVFIGMRFHSLLLSTVSSVPFIAIAYDTKCWRFVEEIAYPYAIKLEDLRYQELSTLYEDALTHTGKIKSKLVSIADAFYDEAEEGLRKLHL